ncbi:MAG TPA: hypothetical protein VF581_01330 [Flavobacterium sp.]|jgi:hypothetical protein
MRKIIFLPMLMVMLFAAVGFKPSDNSSLQSVHSGRILSDTLTWKLLGDIKFVTKPHKDYGDVKFPVVNSRLKAVNNRKVVMSGFIVPIDNTTYALSKNVFASCFFCGKAGPETIVGLKFKDLKGRLKTDQYVTITGTFRVNEGNVDDWIYNIDNAIITKGN